MAENNDVLPNIQYHNPDQLAEALRLKSNETLARRVEDIAVEIKDTSVDWRKALKEQLTGDEERALRETLPGTGVDVLFNENLTDYEEKIRDGSIINDNLPKLVEGAEKAGGFLKSFSEGMSKVSSLLREYKWGQAISEFFKIFSNWWEGKTGKSLDSGKDKKVLPFDVPEVSNDDYVFSLKALVGFSKDKEKNYNAYNLLSLPQIKISNFSKLKGLKENGILEALEITSFGSDKKLFEKQLYSAVQIILNKEDLIEDLIGKRNPTWRDSLTIEQLLTKSYEYTKPYSSFESFSIDDFKHGKINFGSFKFGDPKSDLKSKFEKLKSDRTSKLSGVSNEFISHICLDGTSKITDSNQLEILQGIYPNENDKEFADEFVKFGKSILEKIKSDYFLGDNSQKKAFSEYFNRRSLSSREVFELYLITAGETNNSEINSYERGLIYLKVWSFMSGDPILRGETYDRKIVEYIASGPSALDKIPKPVVDTFKSLLEHATNTIIDKTWQYTQEIFGLLTWTQIASIGSVGILMLAGLLRFGAVRNRILGFTSGIAFASIIAVVAMARNNNPKHFESKYPGESNQKIGKRIQKEINYHIDGGSPL